MQPSCSPDARARSTRSASTAAMLARAGDDGVGSADPSGNVRAVSDDLTADRGQKGWGAIGIAAALTLPAFLMRFGVFHVAVGVETLLFGLGILGAAFLLAWGAEVAQLDISQGLAIAFLAFIAVLPEYAVDLVFAWKAGAADAAAAAGGMPDPCVLSEDCSRQLAIANMTGANRLLIGIGWAVVVLVWWWRTKQKGISLPDSRRTDLGFLFLGTAWAVTIVIRQQANLLDMVVLVTLFGLYVWHAVAEEQEHPELVGPPVAIAALPVAKRRAVTIGLFVFAAVGILIAAEPFAEGLVHIGEEFGISPFLLVQWLAPLASEAPEMIIAILFVLRAKPAQGLGALVSSKVNQWTLLVGTLPLFYAISYGAGGGGSWTHPLHLGGRQVEEVLLTAAQSLFAAAVLANLTISRGEAIMLLVLFSAQLGFPQTNVRYGFSAVYLLMFGFLVIKNPATRRGLVAGVKRALTKPGRASIE